MFAPQGASVAAQRSSHSHGKIAALLALLTVIVAFMPFTPAGAAPDQVKIESIEFSLDDNGEIMDRRREQVSVTWSVPGTATAPVTFAIPLPGNLRGNPDTFNLSDDGGNTVGSCTVTEGLVDCLLDNDYVKANPEQLKGSFFFRAMPVVENRKTEQVTFVFGDGLPTATANVAKNYEMCPAGQDCSLKSFGPWKYADDYNNTTDEMMFAIGVKAGPQGIAPGSKVTVTDHLDLDRFEIVPGFPRVMEGRELVTSNWKRQDPKWEWRQDGITVSDDGRTVEFKSSPGVDIEGSFYKIEWKVRAKDGGEPGPNNERHFPNTATWKVEGPEGVKDAKSESGDVSGTAVRYPGGGSAVGTNYGRFQVTKDLTGDTTLNPDFTVNYTLTNERGVETHSSFTLKSGETYTSPELYKGSRVTLTEVKPTEPSNVEWADPQFVDEQGNAVKTLSFSHENKNLGAITKLTLKNKATLKKGQFTAAKKVENPDNVPVSAEQKYTLNYEYPADKEKGFPAGSGTLELPANGQAVTSSELPVGAQLTLTESGLPNVPGATWGEPVIEPSTITIGDGEPVNVSVTNTITQDLGSFSVTKQVSGDGAGLAPEDATYTVTYEYDEINGFPGGSGEIELKAGETKTVENIPAGATVRLTEVTLDNPEGGTWNEPTFSQNSFTIVKGSTVAIDLDNPISWNKGDFSVTKKVTGEGAELVPSETGFTVDYTYTLPEKLNAEPSTGSGTLTVTNNGEAATSDPLPYGTEVTLSEIAPAKVPGGTWTSHSFDPETFTIGDQSTTSVTLTNEIERDLGSFALTKTVDGTGADLIGDDEEFTVNYSYPAGEGFEAGEGSVTVTTNGTAQVDGLPAGAVVTFEEAALTDPANGSWQAPTFPNGNVVTIGKNETAELSLVNTIDLGKGGFTIEKKIDGSGAELVEPGTTFTVQYKYPAGVGFEAGEGSVEVPLGGEPVVISNLPAGAEVQLSEAEPHAIDGGTWSGSSFSESTVTVGKEQMIEVTLTNTIDKDQPPTPPTQPGEPGENPGDDGSEEPGDGGGSGKSKSGKGSSTQPGDSGKAGSGPTQQPHRPAMARTGAQGVAMIIGIATAVALVGVGAIAVSRRRS